MNKQFFRWLLVSALLLASPAQAQVRVYQEPSAFIRESLPSAPQPRTLWLTAPIQKELAAILGHPPAQLRMRYFLEGNKSAWVLDEIGKEESITAGFVVSGGCIEHARVLVFRESRGDEVRYPAFLAQFRGAALVKDNRLSRDIDGISGATLSVSAMERMARAALYLDRVSREQ